MSSLKGTYQACKEGNSSSTMTCTGASCAGLSKIPGFTCTGDPSTSMTCSNGVTCASVSNMTSSYALQGNGLNITQTHNITIGSQTYSIKGNGANFTKTNTTSSISHSAASSHRVLGLKTFLLIAFILFTTQAYAQSPDSGLNAIDSLYISQLGAVLTPLTDAVCDLVTSGPAPNLWVQAEEVVVVVFSCMVLLMVALTTFVDDPSDILAKAAPNAIVYGSSLPITDPVTLFYAAAADVVVCLDLALAILNDSDGNTPADICDPILATAVPLPTGSAPIPTGSGSAPTDSSAPTSTEGGSAATSAGRLPYPTNTVVSQVHGVPAGWPPSSSSLWSTTNGTCVACKISVSLNNVRITASLCEDPHSTTNAILPVPEPQQLITSYDLSVYLCLPDIIAAWGIQALCDSLCADLCTDYYVDDVVAALGSNYVGGGNTSCYDLCEGSEIDGTTGQCLEEYELLPSGTCGCGAGELVCGLVDGSCTGGVGGPYR